MTRATWKVAGLLFSPTRATCYERAGLTELAERARRDLQRFEDREPAPVVTPRSRPARP